MLEKLEKVIFFLLIFFLPIQLGKHFWPDFSYVQGIRIDYLSPILYVTDILIFLLFIIFITSLFIKRKKKQERSTFPKLLVIFLFIFLLSIITSKSVNAGIFGLIKLFEFYFLGFYVAEKFTQKDIGNFVESISLAALISSIIAISQFIKQTSLNGAFYFLGERSFNGSTPGIANMNINGELILRPYSTFAHPNVLAFFLLFTTVLILFRFSQEKETYRKIIFVLVFAIASITLFLTFSRIIIILYFIFLLFYLLKSAKQTTKKFVLLSLPIIPILILYFNNFYYRFLDYKLLLKDFYLRQDLIDISFSIFKQNPYFGVGPNNFYFYESFYQKTLSPIFLQPVHNIYLLILTQIGILGFILFLIFIIKSFSSLLIKIRKEKKIELKTFYQSIFLIFIAFIITGFFDHFFLTLQQGQLILALILGLCWTKL